MGYWGTLVAVRSNGHVPELLRGRGAEERRHPGALRGGGWQVFDVDDNLLDDETFVSALATELESPVLAAYIADSDHCWIVGVSQAGQWQTSGVAPRRAAEAAVVWVADAGFTVTARSIRRILAKGRPPGLAAWLRLPWQRYAFAEDVFFDLLDSLGIPRQVEPEDPGLVA